MSLILVIPERPAKTLNVSATLVCRVLSGKCSILFREEIVSLYLRYRNIAFIDIYERTSALFFLHTYGLITLQCN